MHGYDMLWQPGYDHAGIATQNDVEKALAREGTSRHDLGGRRSSSAPGNTSSAPAA